MTLILHNLEKLPEIRNRIKSLINTGNYDQALGALDMAIRDFPDRQYLKAQKVMACDHLGQRSIAANICDELWLKNHDDVKIVAFVIRSYTLGARYEKAKTCLDYLSTLTLSNEEQELFDKTLIFFLFQTQDYESCITCCKEYIRKYPDQAYGYENLLHTAGITRTTSDIDQILDIEIIAKKNFVSSDLLMKVLMKRNLNFTLLTEEAKLCIQDKSLEILMRRIEILLFCKKEDNYTGHLIEMILSKDLTRKYLIPLANLALKSPLLGKYWIEYLDNNPQWKSIAIIQESYDILTCTSYNEGNNISNLVLREDVDIDVVFTWISLEDELLDKYIQQEGYDPTKSEKENEGRVRYDSTSTIKLSLLSIQKYFAQVRNIFIVTHDQSFDTSFLSDAFRKKVNFINQNDLFPDYLKEKEVFHSNLVETFLHNIPNLAEHFLYLCDDMVIGNYIKTGDLFSCDGIPYAFVTPIKEDQYKKLDFIYKYSNGRDTPSGLSRVNVGKLYQSDYGVKSSYDSYHQAMFMLRSTCKSVYDQYKDEWQKGFLCEMKRGPKAVFTPLLANLIALYEGLQVLPHPAKFYHNSIVFNLGINEEIVKYIQEEKPIFYCLNFIDEDSEKYLQDLIDSL